MGYAIGGLVTRTSGIHESSLKVSLGPCSEGLVGEKSLSQGLQLGTQSGSIAQGMIRYDSSWGQGPMVLVVGPRPVGPQLSPARGWSYFLVCIWDHSHQYRHLGTGRPSQKGPSWTWTILSLNFLPGSQKSNKGTFFSKWLTNYCCWGGIWVRDLLL